MSDNTHITLASGAKLRLSKSVDDVIETIKSARWAPGDLQFHEFDNQGSRVFIRKGAIEVIEEGASRMVRPS